MKFKLNIIIVFLVFLMGIRNTNAQEKEYYPPPMKIDVGSYVMPFNKIYGEGGLLSQFSWTHEDDGNVGDIAFNWPMDTWKSNSLYQIFNPIVLDENGIIDQYGENKVMGVGNSTKTVNLSATHWAREVRRYRPPNISVDGLPLNPPYRWYVDPTLKSDIKIEFEDICPQFGMRAHAEVIAFSNENHRDYFIWKVTHKFTGELRAPNNLTDQTDTIPDQTINCWFPIAYSFGPTKAGTKQVTGSYGYETEDDLDSWFKRKSDLVPGRDRDSLYVGYYYDSQRPNGVTYPNGSSDDTGDPDRTTGFLYSTQIHGYSLLYADKSVSEKVDDPSQPYSMPHANIDPDIWGRSGPATKLTYIGDDDRGRFPLDPITAGIQTQPLKGPMRFITTGPYEMTKNSAEGRYDSVTFVYAVGAGSISRNLADSIGKAWYNGEISDQEKNDWILTGTDSLWKKMDRANWAWDKYIKNQPIPSPPPPPDITVNSGPGFIKVGWSYPENSYYIDPATGLDDWGAWRVYRKKGALFVNDPLDELSGEIWQLVYETNDKNINEYIDNDVVRGVDYYYAVTAVDNGSQNTSGIFAGQKLESSRFVTRSQLPAVAFAPGLNESDLVRVVPNPATAAAGGVLNAGSPDKISFFNLPVKCKLRIYTETGDLVKTIEHYGSADEEWNQRTDSNQYVTSGIYILVVTNSEDINGKKLDDQLTKFIIVR